MPLNIHGKQYVLVNERVARFHELYPNGSITTDIVYPDEKTVRAASIVLPDVGNPGRKFMGHAEEKRDSSQINRTSATEVAETSAIGRALGFLGIGSEESIASAEEVVGALAKQGLVETQADEPFADDEPAIQVETGYKVCPGCNKQHKGKYPQCYACYLKRNKTPQP